VLLLVSLTEERAIYLALELDRSWTEMAGVTPLDGTNYLNTASAFTIVRVKSESLRVMIARLTDFGGIDHVYSSQGDQLYYQFRQLKSSSRLELNALLCHLSKSLERHRAAAYDFGHQPIKLRMRPAFSVRQSGPRNNSPDTGSVLQRRTRRTPQ
jgi:hypothetical protein